MYLVVSPKIRLAVEALKGSISGLRRGVGDLHGWEFPCLVTSAPVTLEGTSGRVVFDKLKKFHSCAFEPVLCQ